MSDLVTELALSNLNLAQYETNEIPSNGSKRKNKEAALPAKPCSETGSRDLCDDHICSLDAECRSGCCSQVLTKGYSRCVAVLVGDYCPRALDPISPMLAAEKELATKAKQAKQSPAPPAQSPPPSATTELPCNVFGTVDRCDGMFCEHDGNCFSGCCSLFVSGD